MGVQNGEKVMAERDLFMSLDMAVEDVVEVAVTTSAEAFPVVVETETAPHINSMHGNGDLRRSSDHKILSLIMRF